MTELDRLVDAETAAREAADRAAAALAEALLAEVRLVMPAVRWEADVAGQVRVGIPGRHDEDPFRLVVWRQLGEWCGCWHDRLAVLRSRDLATLLTRMGAIDVARRATP